jgi:hypothetical protein
MTEFVVKAGFRTKWQPGWLPGMPPQRKGDILVFDYPSAGRTLVFVNLGTPVGLSIHMGLSTTMVNPLTRVYT